jgi:hypothetical protein
MSRAEGWWGCSTMIKGSKYPTHYVELGIEFCIEVGIGLYQLGAEQMDLPHNFGIGLVLWVVATAFALRIFWILPWTEKWSFWVKTVVATVAVMVLVSFAWSPVQHAYNKKSMESNLVQQKQEPPVQQTNQGNGNTNISGNGNTVINKPTTVISRDDPQAKELIKKLDKVLKSQEDLTPEKLLLKYPLGYVIFDATYQNAVFPYQTRGEVEKWHVKWSSFKYNMTDDSVYFQMPDFTYMEDNRNGVAFWNNTIKCKKVVGSLCGGAFFAMENVQMSGEILAVRTDGVVFLFGFKRIS